MKSTLLAVAVIAGFAAQAGAQELPPQPKLGEPLSAAIDWCQMVGGKIEKQQQPGAIMIGCELGDELGGYTFSGIEDNGYRIERTTAVFLAPYSKLRNWQGPYYCKPRPGISSCESFTRQGNGVKSHALVYFDTKQDKHAMWRFKHAIERGR